MGKPELKVLWIKGKAKIDYAYPNVFFSLGARGGGKSSLLELFAAEYLDRGAKIVDLFGSRDGEGLAWLRSPYAKTKKIALFRGDLVEVTSQHENIAASKFRLTDLDRMDVLVSASPLYESMDAEFAGVNSIIDQLWKRHRWTVPVFIIVREAANLIYSRLKIRQNQTAAKAELLYMIRESRHCGLGLGMDSIKFTSIDIDLRVLTDYMFFKSLGLHSLPDEMEWVYRYIRPAALRNLKASEFVVLDRRGRLGLGIFDMPPWHKLEHEDIMKLTGVDVRYLTPSGGTDQNQVLIKEALAEMPPEPTPGEVAAWIKERHHVAIDPTAVGKHLHVLGYRTELVYRRQDARNVRVIKQLPGVW